MQTGATADRLKKRFFPPRVTSIADTGLDVSVVSDLILKIVYYAGVMRGAEIAVTLCLPYGGVVEQTVELLRQQHFLEVRGSVADSRLSQHFEYLLTGRGEARVQELLRRSTYHGPCPVVLEDYLYGVERQTVRGLRVTREQLQQIFSPLVLNDRIVNQLGPALNSGSSIFLFGPPGNGKTTIAELAAQCLGSDIYIPRVLYSDGQFIRLHDETVHREVEDRDEALDRRWVRIRRPFVVAGGELTLEALDLVWNDEARTYDAPLHMKANGGMLLIDDFGRQRVTPTDLLNRWIIPLDRGVDYLHLATGGSIKIPFDQVIIFATNLEPKDLVDQAFLRRIRYKIEVPPPTLPQLRDIFHRVAQQKGMRFSDNALTWLDAEYYRKRGIQPQACHPLDLLEEIRDHASFLGAQPEATPQLMALACESYFVEL